MLDRHRGHYHIYIIYLSDHHSTCIIIMHYDSIDSFWCAYINQFISHSMQLYRYYRPKLFRNNVNNIFLIEVTANRT